MRYLFSLASVLLFLAATPGDLVAQGKEPGTTVTDSLVATYVLRLNLTSEQETALSGVLEDQSRKAREMIGAARSQGREAMGELRPKLEELQQDTNTRIVGYRPSYGK